MRFSSSLKRQRDNKRGSRFREIIIVFKERKSRKSLKLVQAHRENERIRLQVDQRRYLPVMIAIRSPNLDLVKRSHFKCKQKSPPRALSSNNGENRFRNFFLCCCCRKIRWACKREEERSRWAHATKNKSRENRHSSERRKCLRIQTAESHVNAKPDQELRLCVRYHFAASVRRHFFRSLEPSRIALFSDRSSCRAAPRNLACNKNKQEVHDLCSFIHDTVQEEEISTWTAIDIVREALTWSSHDFAPLSRDSTFANLYLSLGQFSLFTLRFLFDMREVSDKVYSRLPSLQVVKVSNRQHK